MNLKFASKTRTRPFIWLAISAAALVVTSVAPPAHADDISGVVFDLPESDLLDAGFERCFLAPYAHKTTEAHIFADCGNTDALADTDIVLAAASTSDTSTLYLAAQVPGILFLEPTDNVIPSRNSRWINGSYWYYIPGQSIGFSDTPDVYLSECDSTPGIPKLCWHLVGVTGGYRAGEYRPLNSDYFWHKVVYVRAADAEPPTWDVPADIVVDTDPGLPTAVVDYVATPSDNVGVVSSSCSPASGSIFPLGETTVECTAEDAAGNGGEASFTVTVVDAEPPTWSVPADITVNTDPDLATAVVGYVATPSDNVGVVSSSCNPASGSVFPLGSTTVNCTAEDAAGNVGEVSFSVTVVDTEPPTTTLLGDALVTLFVGDSYVDQGATAWDNVDGDLTASIVTVDPVDTGTPGSYLVTYDVADTAGNAAAQVTRTVDVVSPAEMIDDTSDLIESMGLPEAVETSLGAPLGNSLALLSDANPNNDAAACGQLAALLRQIAQLEPRGELTSVQASQLIDDVSALQQALGCT